MQIADLFLKQNTHIVTYKKEVIQVSYDLQIGKGDDLEFVFESTNSKWKQGISLFILSKKTKIEVNNQVTNESNTLWEDTAPKKVNIKIIDIDENKPFLRVGNSWISEKKQFNFPNLGGAMKVKEEDGLLRFYCNDGQDDDDFDDLIFTIKKIKTI